MYINIHISRRVEAPYQVQKPIFTIKLRKRNYCTDDNNNICCNSTNNNNIYYYYYYFNNNKR